jgi:hypothetical protein
VRGNINCRETNALEDISNRVKQGSELQEAAMGRTCSKYREDNKCTQNYGQEAASWKTDQATEG